MQPTADCYVGILKRPAENNAIEDVHVSGVCTALVNIANVDHTRADAVAGDYVLGSSDSGPIEILYAPELAEGQEYPQELECVVRFGSASGAIELCHGLIIEQCNATCSTYRVQRVHRYLKPVCDDDGSGPGSGSGSGSGV